MNKEIQYYVSWCLAFSNTARWIWRQKPQQPCKQKQGNILNLLIIINFRDGKVAFTGGLQILYICKLKSQQLNLQNSLLNKNFDLKSLVKETVIKTHVYGVALITAQSEDIMKKLGSA